MWRIASVSVTKFYSHNTPVLLPKVRGEIDWASVRLVKGVTSG